MPDTPADTSQYTQQTAASNPGIAAWSGKMITAVVAIGFILSYTAGYFTARKLPNTAGSSNPATARTRLTPSATPPIPQAEPVDCTMLECLKSDNDGAYGYAMLTGYYRQYDATQWEWNTVQTTCDSIVPTGGSQTLISDFEHLITIGNTLNKKIDGKLHINIRLSDLTNAEKTLLQQSSEDRPVRLYVVRPVPPRRGASPCDSLLTILKVSPKPTLPEQ